MDESQKLSVCLDQLVSDLLLLRSMGMEDHQHALNIEQVLADCGREDPGGNPPRDDRHPVIYEIDPDTGESTGQIYWFCEVQCRLEWMHSQDLVDGTWSFGFDSMSCLSTVCDNCGIEITEGP